jgi:Flp pilus assembly protein TadG
LNKMVLRPTNPFIATSVRLATDTRGVAAIEFALIASMLSMVLVGMVDLGLGIIRTMQVQYAAQAGAQYAMLHGFDQNAISGAVLSASSSSNISVAPPPSQFCGCPSGDSIEQVSCSASCSSGTAGTYVRVSTQSTYTPLFNYPLIPKSFALSAQSTVRIQ